MGLVLRTLGYILGCDYIMITFIRTMFKSQHLKDLHDQCHSADLSSDRALTVHQQRGGGRLASIFRYLHKNLVMFHHQRTDPKFSSSANKRLYTQCSSLNWGKDWLLSFNKSKNFTRKPAPILMSLSLQRGSMRRTPTLT